MALIAMQDVCWGFGEVPLLDHISLQIEKGQRICLLGRNGVGKSTLLRLIAGDMLPDSGMIQRQQKITISALEQEVPQGSDGTIFEVVARGLGEKGEALAEHHRISRLLENEDIRGLHQKQGALRGMLEAGGGWARLKQSIESVLSQSGLEP